MQTNLTAEQIATYEQDGFLLVDNFLSATELEEWRVAVTEAVAERNGQKMPGRPEKLGQVYGVNKEVDYTAKYSINCSTSGRLTSGCVG